MRLYKLPDTVLKVKGNSSTFLNGITSNTLDAPLNAFLNQHGRIIATFRQQKVSDDEFLIGVPVNTVDNLLKHLERYARLSHVQILPTEQNVFIDLDTAQSVWSIQAEINSISDKEFTLFRLDHNIPLMGIDYQADEFILNVHEFNFVSYTKGCFLGQEPVAKVHNRAKPSRTLTVVYEDQCSEQDKARMTSIAADSESGRRKGFMFVSNKSA